MGKIVKTTISGYGYDGEGVGKFDGKVIFVPYTLRGEEVEVELESEKSSFAKGKINKIIKFSEKRENAPCPYFAKCGGCAFQHTPYKEELNIKLEIFNSHFKKIGFNGNVEIVPSPKEYGYRNKIRLFVGESGLCLKERLSNKLVPIEKCLLISDKMNGAIECIQTFVISKNKTKDYSEVVVRQEGENILINFNKTSNKPVNYQGLYLMLGRNCGIFESYKGKTDHKLGLKLLENEEFSLKCAFSPNSFHQVNDLIEDKLYTCVRDNIVGDNIINCYSGAGVLSGLIAKQKKRVIGIELGQAEHDDAEKIKEENNLFFLTNMQGDCGNVLEKLSGDFSTIIVDPPRSGLDKKVINALLDKNATRIIYISCNSSTCARDICRLEGYNITNVYLFDMFARTDEFEVMVILDKRN